MAIISSLVIALSANSARLNKDLSKTRKRTKKFTRGVSSQFKALGATIAAGLTVRAFGNFTKSLDNIAKSARSVGLSSEDFQLLTGALEEAGLSAEVTQKTIITLQKALGEAAQGTTTYTDALNSIGLEYEQIASLDPTTQLASVVQALKETDDVNIRVAASTVLLGRATKDLGTLLQGGSAGIQEATNRLRRLGVVIGDDALKSAEEFNDIMFALGLQFRALATAHLAPLVKGLSNFAQTLSQYLAINKETIKEVTTLGITFLQVAAGLGVLVIALRAVAAGIAIAAAAATGGISLLTTALSAAAVGTSIYAAANYELDQALGSQTVTWSELSKQVSDSNDKLLDVANSTDLVRQSALSATDALKDLAQINIDADSLLNELQQDEVNTFDGIRDGVGRSISEGIVSGFKSGGVEGALKGFANAVAAELTDRSAAALTDVLFGAKGGNASSSGLLGSLFSNIFANKGGYVTANGIMQFNQGGVVPGSGSRDTVPALLTPGEIVLNPARGQGMGGDTYNISIDAIDTQSFNQRLGSDPRLVAAIVETGQRAITTIRR